MSAETHGGKKKSGVPKRLSKLQEAQSQVKDTEEQLMQVRRSLAAHEDTTRGLVTTIRERDATIRALEAKVKQRDKALKYERAWIERMLKIT